MHITIFIGGLSKGGAERVICNLSNYLVNKSHSVTIITMGDDTPSEVLDKRIERKCLIKKNERKNFLQDSLFRYRRLRSYIREKDTDEYLVLLPVTTFLLLSFRKKINVPIVFSERNNPNSYSTITKLLLRFYCRKVDAFVFQTEEQMLWYSKFVNLSAKRTVVIPNAVNNIQQSDSIRGNNNVFTIISAGRLSPQKNFELLIKAFAIVHTKHPAYRLIIYGQGTMRGKLEKLVHSLNLKDCVSLPGFSRSINEEMGKASMFVMTSDFEGIPNALIEAMQNRLPCVATDCDGGGARLLINNGVNGLLVEKGNVAAVAEAMIKIGGDKELATKLGNAAKESLKNYSPDIIYEKWDAFLLSIENKSK